jgi:hypothetical protein
MPGRMMMVRGVLPTTLVEVCRDLFEFDGVELG